MVPDRTYEFINAMTIPYLTYWNYSQMMDVSFASPMQYLRSCKYRVIFQRMRLLGDVFLVPNS